jgi:hypothetical protein
MKNVRSFIDSGGNATWQFVVFKHNEHQLDDAVDFGKKLGFTNFMVKVSHRFALDKIYNRVSIGSDGTIIEPPINTEYVHDVINNISTDFNIDSWLTASENKKINCCAKKDLSVYIDSEGNIFPCCYIGAYLFSKHPLKINDQWDSLYNTEGKLCNLNTMSWSNIINSNFFDQIEKRWNYNTYSEGRLAICAANCGVFNERINDPFLTEPRKI